MDASNATIEASRSYPVECPACHNRQEEPKSHAMLRMGYNSGCAECRACGSYLHLVGVPDANGAALEAHLFDDIIAAPENYQVPLPTPRQLEHVARR